MAWCLVKYSDSFTFNFTYCRHDSVVALGDRLRANLRVVEFGKVWNFGYFACAERKASEHFQVQRLIFFSL